MNRILLKQMLQAKALQFCQIDLCRFGGVNKTLTVVLLAAKFRLLMCTHAGDVGLYQLV